MAEGSAILPEVDQLDSSPRVVKVRTCASCGRVFNPSSRHLRCPACRSKGRCLCGRPKQIKSKRCVRCTSQAGAWNGNWKGGRTFHKAGYVMVKATAHPRASRHGYVFEHILVMETALGRSLIGDETIHHRNGVRDDNRVGNLELWVKPQPSGIRATDALAWAREIIARYEGMDTSNNAQT